MKDELKKFNKCAKKLVKLYVKYKKEKNHLCGLYFEYEGYTIRIIKERDDYVSV